LITLTVETAHRRDRLLHEARQAGQLLLGLQGTLEHAVADHLHNQDHQRKGDDGAYRQPRVNMQHERYRGNVDDQRIHGAHGSETGQHAHIGEIVGKA
jgi:hypothetical protein